MQSAAAVVEGKVWDSPGLEQASAAQARPRTGCRGGPDWRLASPCRQISPRKITPPTTASKTTTYTSKRQPDKLAPRGERLRNGRTRFGGWSKRAVCSGGADCSALGPRAHRSHPYLLATVRLLRGSVVAGQLGEVAGATDAGGIATGGPGGGAGEAAAWGSRDGWNRCRRLFRDGWRRYLRIGGGSGVRGRGHGQRRAVALALPVQAAVGSHPALALDPTRAG
jgi:hypothetical protein